ncbi:FHA domain-containing protein [Pseudomonas alcaligenes]|uniref:FHA domain-containing protein n=1 Tax=Aquipseudomonas alcaligenes TaxID=43263 RepID=A0ABR7RZJ1_AQUAC|nr:FHA domain-containing protein [Pseudomonas alcaligenes]MBC9249960.1 FHA domain-containing protein [Pseudomonas alcaligenes]
MLKLHFKDSRQAPIWLVEERFTIGQDRRNQLALSDEGIAAFHAEIRQESGLYYISDCDSESGTFVNDERISARYQLRSEDRVRLGEVELLLVDPARSKPKAEATQRWFLQVIKGEHEGKKFHVSGSMTFGRSVKCELCFSDAELSRRHCEFFLKGDVLEVKDLASANGVLVNGEKTSAAVLQPGDQVRMGSVTLLVIGPKVEVQQAEDEDATLFIQAVDLPKPAKPSATTQADGKPVGGRPAATPNPLRAAAQTGATAPAASAPANADGKSRLVLVVGVVLLLAGVATALLLL